MSSVLFRTACLAAATCGILTSTACCAEVEIEHEKGITYGKVGDVELKLDLARPAGDGPFPAIVFIHGGGWCQGNREMHLNDIQEAARRGYVAISVSYRLMQFDEAQKETTTAEPIFPTQVEDVKAAVRWLRANARMYHADGKRIGATGASAGGHLSLMLGLSDADAGLEGDGDHGDQSSQVQAVVNVFGPTEMRSCFEETAAPWIFRLFMGGTPDEVPDTYKAASPLTYVSQGDPPVLTLHGDKDVLVPLSQATKLDEKMKHVGATHTLLVLEGAGHGFAGKYLEQAMQAQWEFFDRHLKP